jgi:hypothetical protein
MVLKFAQHREKKIIGVLKALGLKTNSIKRELNQETIKAIKDVAAGKINKIEVINNYLENI